MEDGLDGFLSVSDCPIWVGLSAETRFKGFLDDDCLD